MQNNINGKRLICYLRVLNFVYMKKAQLLLTLFITLFAARAVADDALLSSPTKAEITAESSSAEFTKIAQTGMDTNSLNLEIGLSKLRLFGYGQMWFDYKNSAGETTNGADVKRIILMADAQITKEISFFLMYDAVESELHEYYAQYTFKPWLQARAGQFKQPFTLESLYSPTFMSTILYDPSVLYLAGIATDPLMGNNVARDTGVMLTGDFFKNSKGRYLFNYSLGVFNGPGMNQSENNSQKDVAGMLKYMPTEGLLLAGSFLVGTGNAQSASPYGRVAEGENYSRHRWSAGLEIKSEPFYLRSEYIQGSDAGIQSRGGYVNFIYTPVKKFDIVLNWDYLNKNTALGKSEQGNYNCVTEQNTYTVGAQYWIYKRCRFSAQYVYTKPRVGNICREFISQLQISF